MASSNILRTYLIKHQLEPLIESFEKNPELLLLCFSKTIDHGKEYDLDPAGNNFLLLAIAVREYGIATWILEFAYKKFILTEFKEMINQSNSSENYFRNTPLTLAIKHEQYKLAIKLLNYGADPNITSMYGISAISIVFFHLGIVQHKHGELLELLQTLLTCKATLLTCDELNFTPIKYLRYDIDGKQLYVYMNIYTRQLKAEPNLTFPWIPAFQTDYTIDCKITNAFSWGSFTVKNYIDQAFLNLEKLETKTNIL